MTDTSPGTVPDDLRRTLRRFAGGVTVVTCRVGDIDHAMTATAVSALSLQPPLVLVCVSKTARFNAAISATNEWALTLLSHDQEAAAVWFATSGRPLEGQLDRFPHRRLDSGMAVLDGGLGWIECTRETIVSAGDHDVIVGRVRRTEHSTEGKPLLYWEGGYHGLD